MFVWRKIKQMEIYHLQKDISVFGKQVETFPMGVKKAFDDLISAVPDVLQRLHYGLSHMTPDGKIIYIAASAEKQEGEAEKLHYSRYVIEKGEYLSVTLKNWMSKTDCIKNIFHEMMQDSRADLTKQVVEWYQTEEEMICLVKTISNNQ
jgi:predicted transcriptional regulator YdeE